MKKLLIVLFVLSVRLALAQAPQGIPYQAVARNITGAVLASTAISVRFTIRDSVATGVIKYRETFSITTTSQGMFSVNVGQGTPVTGTFSGINWGNNAKFMQVEMDPAGGSSYIELGTTQMMSVPYALSAGSVSTITYSPSNNNLTIGMNYGGGKVAYILQPNDNEYDPYVQHGLIAAPSNLVMAQWGCYGSTVGGTSTDYGTGAANTAIVSSACGAGTAARLCADLVLNGYSDWYLPSRDELNTLYINRRSIGGFYGSFTNLYWNSSESSALNAGAINFISALIGFNIDKNATHNVRAVRSF